VASQEHSSERNVPFGLTEVTELLRSSRVRHRGSEDGL